MTLPTHIDSQRGLQQLVSQLEASEKRLALIIERSPDAFVIVDEAGVIQFTNRAADEMFGVDEHVLVGRAFGSPIVVGAYTAVDIVNPREKGLVAEMRAVATDWAGQKADIVVLRDITERSRAERRLREQEKRLTLAMDVAKLSFWDLDVATGKLTEDEKLLRSLGYEHGEIEPQRDGWYALVHPADLPRVRRAFEEHLQGQRPAIREQYRIRAKSGEWRSFLTQAEVVEHDLGGSPVRLIGVTEDITERRGAELEHEKTQAKLSLAAELAHLGFWEWEHRTNDVYFSPEWKKQLGYASDELTVHFEEFASRLHPDDQVRTLTAYLDLPRLQRPALEMEYRLRHKDGSYRWIAARMMLIHDDAEHLPRVLGTHLDITEHKLIEERIRQVSQHDPLTGLPNRALLYEFAEHLLSGARRDGKCAAFLFVDLDRFKPINDTYGHAVGDFVLNVVASRLGQCVRGNDLVARLGGDEFLVVLSNVAGEEDAVKVATNVLESLARSIHVADMEISVTPSIGISMFPDDGEHVDELINNADAAMYQVKEHRKNDFQFFRQELNEHAQEVLRLESRLRSGFTQQEFVLFYQAVMDTETEAVVGAEALLRWPTMLVGPERFIPVAEKAGFMPILGDWVVREACRQQREWHDKGLPPFPVAVNVSSLQFRDKHFARKVRGALADAGLGPGTLSVEITESTVMRDVEEASEILNELRGMGVKIALDDFGTGYSSLSHLSLLPIDILKLDQSFVKGVGRNGASIAVAEGILALGKSMGLEVIAEGVESAEALEYLRKRQCGRSQGFHFCRPMPAVEFEQWCRGRLGRPPVNAH